MRPTTHRAPRGWRSVLIAALTLLLGCLAGAPLGPVAPAHAAAEGDLVGQVVDGQGDGVPGIQVVATPFGGSAVVAETETESSADPAIVGTWTLTLPVGAYTLVFSSPGEEYAAQTRTVAVVAGANTLLLVEMAAFERARLSGRVLGSAGGTVAGADVTLVRRSGTSGSYEYDDVDTDEADAQGRYAFDDVRVGPGQLYTVRAAAPGFREGYLDGGSPDLAAATFREVTGPHAFPALTLRATPSVSGVVSGPDGERIAGVAVELLSVEPTGPPGEGELWDPAAATTTDAAGRYTLPVEPGEFTLRFDPTGLERPMQPQYLARTAGPAHPSLRSDAQVFVVDSPPASQVFDVLLSGAARGRVVRDGGRVEGATIRAFTWDNARWHQYEEWTTGPEDEFLVGVPGDRLMTFAFRAPGESRWTFLDGTAATPRVPDGTSAVWTGTRGIDLGTLDLVDAWPGLRELRGQVLDQHGTPVPGISLALLHRGGPWDGEALEGVEESGGDGSFLLTALPGDYTVQVTGDPGPCVVGPAAVTLTDDVTSYVLPATCPEPSKPEPEPGPPPAPGPQPQPPSPPAAGQPGPSAPAKATSTVKLRSPAARVRLKKRVVVVVKVRAAARGKAAGVVKIRAGKRVVARVRVRGQQRGVTVRLRFPARKLGVGKHRLQAVYGGNATTAGGTSGRIKIRVRR